MSKRYFDRKEKGFYELRVGKLSDNEYITKFLEFFQYVTYLKEKKEKFHKFINGIPQFFKDHIEHDIPKTLDDVI